jgi:hypothetical protein
MNEIKSINISELQRSYLVGRKMKSNLGGVACHAYFEFEGEELDVDTFKKAWKATLKSHFMTSAKIKEDGKAYLSKEKLPKRLFIFDFSKEDKKAIETALKDCRKNLSHRKMELSRGQGVGGELFLLPENKHHFCFDIDLAVCDVNGVQELLNELGTRYRNHDFSYAEFTSCFCDNKVKEQEIVGECRNSSYGQNAGELSDCNYESFDYKLTSKESEMLRKMFTEKEGDLFSGMLFLLAKTCVDHRLCVNVPFFKKSLSKEDPVSDNTKIFWMNIEKEKLRLYELQKRIEAELSQEDRAYKKADGIVPVVYSYNQNGVFLNDDFINSIGKMTYMISQTPNVCLDVQLFNMLDGILISFVYPKELEGVQQIKEWFDRYIDLIKESLGDGN